MTSLHWNGFKVSCNNHVILTPPPAPPASSQFPIVKLKERKNQNIAIRRSISLGARANWIGLLMALAGKKRPSEVPVLSGGTTAGDPNDPKTDPKKHKPLPESKFGGMTEEEVCKLLLPDHMKPGLDIIFVRKSNIKPTFSRNSNFLPSDWYQSWPLFCLSWTPLLQCQQSFLWV